MDAEIELELAQGGLCCMMGGISAIAGATGGAATGASVGGGVSGAITAGTVGGPSGVVMAPLRDGGGGGAAHEGHTHHRCRLFSPTQVSGHNNTVQRIITVDAAPLLLLVLSGLFLHVSNIQIAVIT